ncbi:ABC transporter substrate-binding protein [Bradyrhizobium sp. PRIMUS42]|uniref:ABC transporter substrate-binding protein n=1 Tax=Bradyrhizobium sp. PRIMUS42 TaxID=2908926 RepID=UPI001FF21E04|nr:ABC transporter substrate-binding protein [Bradyrhizobium sp. PRIMUS42]MCJ9728676.1 ABC transporter substrate-binding protein [Bradyrhizobium sp. PRIMUS42]
MKHATTALAIAGASLISFGIGAPARAQMSDDVVKIGFITDISGPYADIDGMGGVEAVKMAIADFGGTVNGKKIELVYADHQNKADIAANKVKEWFDAQGVDMLLGGSNSAAGLAMAFVATERKKVYINVGAATARLTNEDCKPYTIHYSYDTVALAKGTGGAVVRQGGKSWFFITADYAFGLSLEADTTNVVKANGGTVVGSSRHPTNSSDFSSNLLQAQGSKAQILGLANAGGDLINTIKGANEFGVTKTMKMAALLMYLSDVHSLGLKVTEGLYLTDAWYWDTNEETRKWAKRYFEKTGKMPNSGHAADYSAIMTYLTAVKAAGTDDGEKVMPQLKSMKINDVFATGGYIRPDGRMVHDMYLAQVKSPAESKYPWDYLKLVEKIPGDQAFTTQAESKCAAWK